MFRLEWTFDIDTMNPIHYAPHCIRNTVIHQLCVILVNIHKCNIKNMLYKEYLDYMWVHSDTFIDFEYILVHLFSNLIT